MGFVVCAVFGVAFGSFLYHGQLYFRAKEHLPNTLKQALICECREMGYLSQAMVNYLALLGWGDGTENEFFSGLQQLEEKFSINWVNKNGAVFDLTKLREGIHRIKANTFEISHRDTFSTLAKNFVIITHFC